MKLALPALTLPRVLFAVFVCGGILGGLGGTLLPAQGPANVSSLSPDGDAAMSAVKADFRRPATVPFPRDNPYSEAKRALGRSLFHDSRLSASGTISCASCHVRNKGFADGRARSVGVGRRPLARHTPTLWNLAWARNVFWDGRARSLEEQVAGPIEAPDEMGRPWRPPCGGSPMTRR